MAIKETKELQIDQQYSKYVTGSTKTRNFGKSVKARNTDYGQMSWIFHLLLSTVIVLSFCQISKLKMFVSHQARH